MNDVIRETKELIPNDTYVQRLSEFVPAGKNPELSDALIVIRQVRQGLSRFKTQVDPISQRLRRKHTEAMGIYYALRLYVEENMDAVSKDEIQERGGQVTGEWLIDYDYFNFERLDKFEFVKHLTSEDD